MNVATEPEPTPATKPAQLRIRVADEDLELIETLGGRVLTPPAVAAMLVAAALEAIRQNGGVITFPPRFTVNPKPLARHYAINEASSKEVSDAGRLVIHAASVKGAKKKS